MLPGWRPGIDACGTSLHHWLWCGQHFLLSTFLGLDFLSGRVPSAVPLVRRRKLFYATCRHGMFKRNQRLRVAAHQVLTIFLIVVARRAFHFPETRWLPTSPGISAVTRPQALVGVDAATSHWPQSDRQGPMRRFSAAQSCFQEVGRSSRSSWRSGSPLVSRLHVS